MLLWPILLVAVIFYFLYTKDKDEKIEKETPLDILKKRYARGEITKEEFEERKKDLM